MNLFPIIRFCRFSGIGSYPGMVRILFFCLLWLTVPLSAEISALYLSWYQDPATTMTIQWHTPKEDTSDTLQLLLDGTKTTFTGIHYPFPSEPLLIHTVRLKNLLPDTEYTFQIEPSPLKYTFRTAPLKLTRPLRFIIGGDLYQSPSLFRQMSHTVTSQDPLFAVLGGDIAYALGNLSLFSKKPATRWRKFLADWTEHLKTPSGRLIPFLLVAGNHDVSSYHQELFFALFDFPTKQLYRNIDFGAYLSLLLLDTGHFSPIAGEQTEWLQKALATRKDIPYLFPVYHVGAYPSFYAYDDSGAKKVRKYWCPLFDQYSLPAAFEHHSHTYKKTFPIKAEQKAPSGTIYFGDGCWGAKPRKPQDHWYLEKIGSLNHVYLIEMTPDAASIRAIGLNGELIDNTEIRSRK